MKIIISQKYKNKKNGLIYIIDSIRGDVVFVKGKQTISIKAYTVKEFREEFEEYFND